MKISNDEKKAIIRKFKKICIRCWTSEQYRYPADSKDLAERKATEASLFLEEVLDAKDDE